MYNAVNSLEITVVIYTAFILLTLYLNLERLPHFTKLIPKLFSTLTFLMFILFSVFVYCNPFFMAHITYSNGHESVQYSRSYIKVKWIVFTFAEPVPVPGPAQLPGTPGPVWDGLHRGLGSYSFRLCFALITVWSCLWDGIQARRRPSVPPWI